MTSDSEYFDWTLSRPNRRPFLGIAVGTLAVSSAAILVTGPPGPLGLHTAQSITRSLGSGVKKAARATDASGQPNVRPTATAAMDHTQKAVTRHPGVARWAAPAQLGKAKPTKAKPRSARTKYARFMPARTVAKKRFAYQSAFLSSAKRSKPRLARNGRQVIAGSHKAVRKGQWIISRHGQRLRAS